MDIQAKLEECHKISEKKKKTMELYEKLLANVKKEEFSDFNVKELN